MDRDTEILVAKIIEKTLYNEKLYVDYVEYNNGIVDIHISWGDWKHEHLRCDYIMEQLGYTCFSESVTEEDGSDCYSALHRYKKV